jgi:hypothetical protein
VDFNETAKNSPLKQERRKWLRELLIVIVGIFIGQAILFGPSLIGRKILLPLDVLAGPGIYIPQTPESEKIEQRDWSLVDQTYFEPLRHFAAEEVRAGRVPMWSPRQFAGAPYLGSKFSPFGILENSTTSPIILAWSQMLVAMVAGLGAYFFFRSSLQVSFWPAAICAWCYPASGFFIFFMGYVRVAVWFPWLLLAVDKTARGAGKWALPGLSAATCLVLVSGQMDLAGQLLLGSGIYGLWILWESWRIAGQKMARKVFAHLTLGWAIGFLLGAPAILPTVEYTNSGSRMQRRAAGTEERPPVGLAALPQVVLPDIYGSSQTGSYPTFPAGQGNLQESTALAYAGVVATFFAAPLAFFSRRHRRFNWFWIFLAAFGLSWSLNMPGVVQFLRLPGLNMMSHNRLVFLTCFAVLALSATGLDVLYEQAFAWRKWVLAPALLLIGLCGWCVFRTIVLPEPVGHQLEKMVKGGIDTGEWVHDLEGVRRAQAWFVYHSAAAAAWCALGLGCWLLLKFVPSWQRRVVIIAGTVMVANLYWFAYGRNTQSDPSLYFPSVPALQHVAENVGHGRVIGYDCLPANLSAIYGLRDVRGYDAVDPKSYMELLAPGIDPKSKVFEYAQTQWLIPKAAPTPEGGMRLYPVFDLLGVRFVIFRGALRPGAKPVFQSTDYWVMENRNALDRAFVPRHVEVAPNAAERLKKLGAPDFDPRAAAYVESPVSLPEQCEGSVAITDEIPTRVTISLKMNTAGLVVLSDLFHPGWKAYLNGNQVPVLRADHALRGVVVPAGTGTLEFRYQPASFRLGLACSALGIVLLLGWVWAARKGLFGPIA